MPTANPAAPRMAMNEVIWMPTMPATVMMSRVFKTASMMEQRKDCRDWSKFLRAKTFCNNVFTHLTSFQPIHSTSNATRILGMF